MDWEFKSLTSGGQSKASLSSYCGLNLKRMLWVMQFAEGLQIGHTKMQVPLDLGTFFIISPLAELEVVGYRRRGGFMISLNQEIWETFIGIRPEWTVRLWVGWFESKLGLYLRGWVEGLVGVQPTPLSWSVSTLFVKNLWFELAWSIGMIFLRSRVSPNGPAEIITDILGDEWEVFRLPIVIIYLVKRSSKQELCLNRPNSNQHTAQPALNFEVDVGKKLYNPFQDGIDLI